MIASALVAVIFPFELFLLAYAILGPLHYLTEVSWLQKKGFYIKGKYDYWIFVILGLLVTLAFLKNSFGQTLGGHNYVFAAFILGIALIFIETWYLKILITGLALLAGFIMQENYFYYMFFAIFLPTLIHVYVFTGIFVIYGSLKSKSISGYISAIVFIGCTAACFLIDGSIGNKLTAYGQKTYSLFLSLNQEIIRFLGFDGHNHLEQGNLPLEYLFFGSKPVMLMRFIAFAYTYHYLNWFSKTSIIKWHEVSATRLMVIGILWAFAVILYFKDYMTGLKVLYFLSMAHVFLEFPLNYRSFSGIGQEIKTRMNNRNSISA